MSMNTVENSNVSNVQILSPGAYANMQKRYVGKHTQQPHDHTDVTANVRSNRE